MNGSDVVTAGVLYWMLRALFGGSTTWPQKSPSVKPTTPKVTRVVCGNVVYDYVEEN